MKPPATLILARSPLRITLGGGGTDLPSYYRDHGGFLIAAAIDRHVYVVVHRTFLSETLVRYSKIERVDDPTKIRHPIIREALDLVGVRDRNLEITTFADIPSGTGLGSSGAFGAALLKALHRFRNRTVDPHALAELASHIEIERLGEPVGKQDTYASACGGLNCYDFRPDDSVRVTPLELGDDTLERLQHHLLLFYTRLTRSAPTILAEQDEKTRTGAEEMLANLHRVKEIGLQSKACLESGDLEGFAELMHEHWERKRKRSAKMSTPEIDELYSLARANSAIGGKLVGAGGGGFLMVYASDPTRLRRAMAEHGTAELSYRFDFTGAQIVTPG